MKNSSKRSAAMVRLTHILHPLLAIAQLASGCCDVDRVPCAMLMRAGCERVIQPEEELWTCAGCFGYDLCGTCHAASDQEHMATRGPDHTFQRER